MKTARKKTSGQWAATQTVDLTMLPAAVRKFMDEGLPLFDRPLSTVQVALLHLRAVAQLSRAEMARECGLSYRQLMRIENGELLPTKAALGRMAAMRAGEEWRDLVGALAKEVMRAKVKAWAGRRNKE